MALVLAAFPGATVGLRSLVPSAALRKDPVFAPGFPPSDPARTIWDTSGVLVHYPAQSVAAEELRRGRLPLWNPFVGAGAPLLAEAHSTPLSPLLLPFFLHPGETTYTWYLLLRIVLAAAGAFLVARARGQSREGAALAAAAYALSGCAAARFDLPTEGTAYALLPYLVLAAGRGMAAFALVTGLAIYSAHPELAALATLGAIVLHGADAPRDPRRWARLGAGAALGGAVGALVALPLLAYAASGVTYKTDALLGGMFASDLIYLPAAPDVLRVGAAPLAFACVAWLSSRRRREAAATAGALLAFLALGAALVVVQAWGPAALRSLVPPRYALFLTIFASALLAGEGLDALARGEVSRRALAAGAGAALVAWIGADLLTWGRLHRIPDVVAGDLAAVLVSALAVARPRLRRLVPLVTAAVLVVSARRVVPAAGEGIPATEAWRAVRALPRAPARIVGIGPWLDRTPLTPNVATLSGHADVRLVAAIAPASWVRYLEGAAGWRRQPTSFLVERLDAAHLDALGVLYAVARADAEVPSGWKVVWRGDGVVIAENQHARPRVFVEGGGAADLVAYTPARVAIDATAARESRVVLTDAFAPGWRAEVDGRPAAIQPFEGAFRAVAVGPGRHRVVMTYRPLSVLAGEGVAGVAIALCLAVLAAARWRPKPTP